MCSGGDPVMVKSTYGFRLKAQLNTLVLPVLQVRVSWALDTVLFVFRSVGSGDAT